MKVNLKGFQGPVKKSSTVFSNDTQNPRATLTMEGNVKALIEVKPSTNVVFRGLADQATENALDILAVAQPFHIKNVEANLEDKAAYNLETVEDGKQYRLKISNKVKEGNYSGFIRIVTDLDQKPEILIRVSGYIEGEVSVKPKTILIGKLAAGQPVRLGKVMVTSNRDKPFKITKLNYDEKLLQVVQQALPEGGVGYSLDITPKLESLAPGSRQQTSLIVETDAAPEGKYEVQIHVLNMGDSNPPAAAAPEGQQKQSTPPAAPGQGGKTAPSEKGKAGKQQ